LYCLSFGMANDWTTTLAAFLRADPHLAAIRVDASRRTVAVATMGAVDEQTLQLLQAQLAETLSSIEA
jgi:hypothetical protein